ncbi:hypothetical protein SUDANB178_00704 [Streptomyces sp. enrichment culture]
MSYDRGGSHAREPPRGPAGRGLLHAGDLVVHRVLGRPPPRAAAHRVRPAGRRPGGARTVPARHHRARADLPRRRADRRRPARHHGQPHRPARPGEGAPGRRAHGRRVRRHRRPRPGHGAALPGRADPLREGRGRPHDPRRQGDPPRGHDPAEPRPGHAGARRRPAAGRLRPHRAGGRTRPDLRFRPGRRAVREAALPRRGQRLPVCPGRPEEAVPGGPDPPRGRPRRAPGAVRRGGRRLGPPADPTCTAASSPSSRSSPRTATNGCPPRRRRNSPAPWSGSAPPAPTGRTPHRTERGGGGTAGRARLSPPMGQVCRGLYCTRVAGTGEWHKGGAGAVPGGRLPPTAVP